MNPIPMQGIYAPNMIYRTSIVYQPEKINNVSSTTYSMGSSYELVVRSEELWNKNTLRVFLINR